MASKYQEFVGRYIKDHPGSSIKDAAAAWRNRKGSGSPTQPGTRGDDAVAAPRFSRGHIRRSS